MRLRSTRGLWLRWLTYLLTDLGEQPRSPLVLYVDNKAMLALCREHRVEHRTKHIALRYFLARELQQRGQLRLAYVASEANTADIFTKALAPGDHQCFCTMLGFPTCQFGVGGVSIPTAAVLRLSQELMARVEGLLMPFACYSVSPAPPHSSRFPEGHAGSEVARLGAGTPRSHSTAGSSGHI
ncbi:unnamed protein product [Closterium sp. NIES-54]